MEIGSIADWVSGVGSFGAIIIVWWQVQKDKKVRLEYEYKKVFELLNHNMFEIESFIRSKIYKIGYERSISKKQVLCNEIIHYVNYKVFIVNKLIVDLGTENYDLQDQLFENLKRLNEKNIKLYEINNDPYDEEKFFKVLTSINLNINTIKAFILDYHMKRNQ